MKAQNGRQAGESESYFSCVIRHCGQCEQCVFSVVDCGQSIWLPGEQRPAGLDLQIPVDFTVHESDIVLCVCRLCIHMFKSNTAFYLTAKGSPHPDWSCCTTLTLCTTTSLHVSSRVSLFMDETFPSVSVPSEVKGPRWVSVCVQYTYVCAHPDLVKREFWSCEIQTLADTSCRHPITLLQTIFITTLQMRKIIPVIHDLNKTRIEEHFSLLLLKISWSTLKLIFVIFKWNYLNNSWMDSHDILYGHSCPPQDEL